MNQLLNEYDFITNWHKVLYNATTIQYATVFLAESIDILDSKDYPACTCLQATSSY